jgi:hypothetical protein
LLDLTQGLFEELCHKGSLAHRSREITMLPPLGTFAVTAAADSVLNPSRPSPDKTRFRHSGQPSDCNELCHHIA